MLVAQRLLSLEMDPATRVQIQNEAVCIWHSVNTLGNGMNIINHGMATGLKEWKPMNSNQLCFKIDRESHPARDGGVG